MTHRLDTLQTLMVYSEWLDSEGFMLHPRDSDSLSHEDLARAFVDYWLEDSNRAILAGPTPLTVISAGGISVPGITISDTGEANFPATSTTPTDDDDLNSDSLVDIGLKAMKNLCEDENADESIQFAAAQYLLDTFLEVPDRTESQPDPSSPTSTPTPTTPGVEETDWKLFEPNRLHFLPPSAHDRIAAALESIASLMSSFEQQGLLDADTTMPPTERRARQSSTSSKKKGKK